MSERRLDSKFNRDRDIPRPCYHHVQALRLSIGSSQSGHGFDWTNFFIADVACNWRLSLHLDGDVSPMKQISYRHSFSIFLRPRLRQHEPHQRSMNHTNKVPATRKCAHHLRQRRRALY